MIEAEDLDGATQIASRIPSVAVGSAGVRPVRSIREAPNAIAPQQQLREMLFQLQALTLGRPNDRFRPGAVAGGSAPRAVQINGHRIKKVTSVDVLKVFGERRLHNAEV